jgi:hypothetical protein
VSPKRDALLLIKNAGSQQLANQELLDEIKPIDTEMEPYLFLIKNENFKQKNAPLNLSLYQDPLSYLEGITSQLRPGPTSFTEAASIKADKKKPASFLCSKYINLLLALENPPFISVSYDTHLLLCIPQGFLTELERHYGIYVDDRSVYTFSVFKYLYLKHIYYMQTNHYSSYSSDIGNMQLQSPDYQASFDNRNEISKLISSIRKLGDPISFLKEQSLNRLRESYKTKNTIANENQIRKYLIELIRKSEYRSLDEEDPTKNISAYFYKTLFEFGLSHSEIDTYVRFLIYLQFETGYAL